MRMDSFQTAEFRKGIIQEIEEVPVASGVAYFIIYRPGVHELLLDRLCSWIRILVPRYGVPCCMCYVLEHECFNFQGPLVGLGYLNDRLDTSWIHKEAKLFHKMLFPNLSKDTTDKPEACNVAGSEVAADIVDEFGRERKGRVLGRRHRVVDSQSDRCECYRHDGGVV
jgi:hypothetical protein